MLRVPGNAHGYSGEGFQFLQQVMERIMGEDYEVLMRRALLDPLGMKGSSHVWNDDIAREAAEGHDAMGMIKAPRRTYSRPNPAYSLYCTPREYAAFVIEMMSTLRQRIH